MDKNETLIRRIILTVVLLFALVYDGKTQSIFISNGSSMHVTDDTFNAGGWVKVVLGGTLSLNPNANWVATNGQWVTGVMTINGIKQGEFIIPLSYQTISKELGYTLTGSFTDFTAEYKNLAASSLGENSDVLGANFELCKIGYWEVNGGALTDDHQIHLSNTKEIGHFTDADGDALINGKLYVASSPWADADSHTIVQSSTHNYAYAGNSWAAGLEDDVLDIFKTYPNPVSYDDSYISFEFPSSTERIDIEVFNINGKKIRTYKNVDLSQNSIEKPLVSKGLYLFKFSFNEGEAISTKKILLE